MSRRRAFTLIELLVVIALIALLISIIMPSLAASRAAGQSVRCLANMKQFGMGLLAFGSDNNDYLPGVYTWQDPDLKDWQRDWLSGTFGEPSAAGMQMVWENAPYKGTLFPYVGQQDKLYRCPSLQAAPLGAGYGSNGRYDCTLIGRFCGARLDRLRFNGCYWLDGNPYRSVALSMTPIFIEEDPQNHLNNSWYAGSFAENDTIGTQHRGVSNYLGSDGSAHPFPQSLRGAWAEYFMLIPPSGQGWISTGEHDAPYWGWWNDQ